MVEGVLERQTWARTAGRIVDVKSLVFVGFLYAGMFKSDPRLAWLPVDLTLLLGGLSAVFAGYRVVCDGFRLPKTLLAVWGVCALFAVPVFWTDWTPYATEKVTRLFTLTLLAISLPVLLFKTWEGVRQFLNALLFVGLLLVLEGAVIWLAGPLALNRLRTESAESIALGTTAGTTAVWVAVLGIEGRLKSAVALVLLLAVLGVAAAVMFASGSRGPLLALMATLVVTGVLFYRRRIGAVLRFAIAGVVAFVCLVEGASVAPSGSAQRIEHALRGEYGRSEELRAEAYVLSLQQIVQKPIGVGWGGFEEQANLRTPYGRMKYPHNLVLEVSAEGGCLLGAFLVVLLLAAVYRTYLLGRASPSAEPKALFALLLFSLGGAMVSGDLNDHRLLFVVMTLAFALRPAGACQRSYREIRRVDST